MKKFISAVLAVMMIICSVPVYANGESENDDTYYVSTADELIEMAKKVNSGDSLNNKTISIEGDIDLLNSEWPVIGDSADNPFMGSIEGNGHAIKNLKTSAKSFSGLIGYMIPGENSSVKNISVENAEIHGSVGGGLIAVIESRSGTSASLQNIIISGSVDVNSGDGSGGLIGRVVNAANSSVKIHRCENNASIYSQESLFAGDSGASSGGLIGKVINYFENSSLKIDQCLNHGNIEAYASFGYCNSSTGGLIGHLQCSDVEITQCFNDGLIEGTAYYAYVGGLIGNLDMSTVSVFNLKDSYVNAQIKSKCTNGTSQAGGLIGHVSGDSFKTGLVENCYATGSMDANNRAGLICWYGPNKEMTIQSCYFDMTKFGLNSDQMVCRLKFFSTEWLKSEIFNSSGVTSDKMKSPTTYLNWDWESVWIVDESINDGYPCFRYLFAESEPGSSVATAPLKKIGTFDYFGPFPWQEKSNSPEIGHYSYSYDETWFEQDSTTYHHDLARMSMKVALAAYGNGSGGTEASKNIKKLLVEEGGLEFSNFYAHYPVPERNSIGYAIASKNIKGANDEYSLIVIAIRGGGYGSEWGGNFVVGNDTDHEGWTLAKDQVLDGLKDFLQLSKGLLKNHKKIWICGYSRGAAVTNLVAKELDDGTVSGVDVQKNDIYAYGFEVPQTTRNENCYSDAYSNIYNIVNPADIVTKVVMSKMGYGRYGNSIILPYHGGFSDYEEYFSNTRKKILEIAENCGINSVTIPNTVEASKFDKFMDAISIAYYNDVAGYVKEAQEPIAKFFERIMNNSDAPPSGVPLQPFNSDDLLRVLMTIPRLMPLFAFTTDKKYQPNRENLMISTIKTLVETHFFCHTPELCMAWLESLEIQEDYLPFDGATHYYEYRRVFINCPVDVEVYNSFGYEVGGFMNGKSVTSLESEICTYVDSDGQMILILPSDEEYRIEMSATENGEVTYTATEYNFSGDFTQKVVSYYQVSVNQGEKLVGIAENLEKETGTYPLLKDESPIEPTIEQSEGDVQEYSVTVTSTDGGEVYGGGSYISGEFAEVWAEAEDGWSFDGWYIDGKKVSREKEYRFLVNSDIDLEARFTNEDSSMIPTPVPSSTPNPTSEPMISPETTAEPSTKPEPTSDPSAAPEPTAGPGSSTTPTSKPTPTTTPSPAPTVSPSAAPTATPKPDDYLPVIPGIGSGSGYQPEEEWEYVPGPDEVTYSGFPDVDPNAWYAGSVGWAAQSGVTAGYPDGNFHPDDTCTRAQIVTFLWKAAGTPMSVGTVSFSDVEQGSFYYDAAVWAANSGIIAGYPDGNFHPDDPCTRAQIVAMLYRYANSPAVSGESKFFDVDAGAYYYNAAIWAEQNGIVAGYPDGGFHPDDACTRAQIVTMLYNYIKG